MTRTLFAWIDLETTGLDPENDHLLEVACLITDDTCKQVIGTFYALLPLPDGWDHAHPELWPVDPAVLDMHTRSGLWADIRNRAHAPAEDDVVDDLMRWIADFAGDGVTIHPAGSGISRFDIPWLFSRVDPDIGWPLHYRELDISGMRMVFERAGWTVRRDGGPAHRARRDVGDEIDEYLFMSGLITAMRDESDTTGTWPKLATR